MVRLDPTAAHPRLERRHDDAHDAVLLPPRGGGRPRLHLPVRLQRPGRRPLGAARRGGALQRRARARPRAPISPCAATARSSSPSTAARPAPCARCCSAGSAWPAAAGSSSCSRASFPSTPKESALARIVWHAKRLWNAATVAPASVPAGPAQQARGGSAATCPGRAPRAGGGRRAARFPSAVVRARWVVPCSPEGAAMADDKAPRVTPSQADQGRRDDRGRRRRRRRLRTPRGETRPTSFSWARPRPTRRSPRTSGRDRRCSATDRSATPASRCPTSRSAAPASATPTSSTRAVERGINYFDTSPDYSRTGSEQVIGKALKPHRDKVYIASKFCTADGHLPHDTPVRRHHRRGRRQPAAPADRLPRRLHHPRGQHLDRLMAPTFHEAFDRLHEQGKVRFLGVSSHTPNLEAGDAPRGRLRSLPDDAGGLQLQQLARPHHHLPRRQAARHRRRRHEDAQGRQGHACSTTSPTSRRPSARRRSSGC